MKVRHQIEKIFWDLLGTLSTLLLRCFGLYRRGYQNALALQVKRLTIPVKNLPASFRGFRLMIMSDLHIDGIKELPGIINERLRGEAADVCCFLGDYQWSLSNNHVEVLELMQQVLKFVSAHRGIYAIPGNHDDEDLIEQLGQIGITILKNIAVPIQMNGDRIWLVGVDDPHERHRDDLKSALINVPHHECKILLAHSPDIIEKAALAGIQLYLTGHTHGGQICLKNLGPIITNSRVPRRYGFGHWQLNGMVGYTSNGVGTAAIPVRFNCPPEIVIITLVPAHTG